MKLDVTIMPILVALIEELDEERAAREIDPFCFHGIIPGTEAILDLGNPKCRARGHDGHSWVRIATGGRYLESQFPAFTIAPDASTQEPQEFGYTIEVGAARTAPTLDKGQAPSVDEMFEYMKLMTADMRSMEVAICRALRESGRIWSLGAYTPLANNGGIAGGTWSVTVGQRKSD